jgi:hypothetical protein
VRSGVGGAARAVLSCHRCGGDQSLEAASDWFSCGVCHETFLLRRCPGCDDTVQLVNGSGRLACPICGRGYSRRRWDKHPVTAADARSEPGVHVAIDKPDLDHRVVSGSVIACAGLKGLRPGDIAEIEFAADGITIWYPNDHEELVDHGLSYENVDFFRVSGRGEITTATDAGALGGGFGFEGALEGMAVASLINSVTRKAETTIETFVHLKAKRAELLLMDTTVSPQILSVRLGPAFDLVAAARRSPPSALSSGQPPRGPDVTDHLVKLSDLHQAGLLTADEFAAAKDRLLGT